MPHFNSNVLRTCQSRSVSKCAVFVNCSLLKYVTTGPCLCIVFINNVKNNIRSLEALFKREDEDLRLVLIELHFLAFDWETPC